MVAAALMLTACSQDSSCEQITREEAVKRAMAAKSSPSRIRVQDRLIWANNEVEKVELNDGRGWGALVHFRGDGAGAPIAIIYEDCEVGWTR
jgi:hypothetical protein